MFKNIIKSLNPMSIIKRYQLARLYEKLFKAFGGEYHRSGSNVRDARPGVFQSGCRCRCDCDKEQLMEKARRIFATNPSGLKRLKEYEETLFHEEEHNENNKQ
ncbi:MAG: hypothetical protein WC523_04070 [Patescibacteria group bacterium]